MDLFSKTHKLKDKKSANALLALTAAAAVLVTSLFSTPADILKEDPDVSPTQIVQVIDDTADNDDGDDDSNETEEKRGIKAKIRRILLRLPFAVRVCVLVPLWGVGFVLSMALNGLFKLLIAPLLGAVIKLLLFTLLAAALVLLGLKLLFPDIPLRLLLTKANLLIILCSSLLIGIISSILETVYPEVRWLPGFANIIGSSIVLLIIATKVKYQLQAKK